LKIPTIYIAILVVLVIISGVLGYLAGFSTRAPSAPVTYTLSVPFTVYSTVYATQTPTAITSPTPTREELLKPIIEEAKKEGKLVIYSTFDRPSAEPLLKAFQSKYPFITVEYVELGTVSLYNRYLQEKAAGAPTADILWSTGVDLQYTLILQGSAQPYRLTIYDKIPAEAKYKDLAYVPYYGLIAPIYNTQKIPKDLAPKSYDDVLRLLTERKDLFSKGSVVVFDIERSTFGLVFTYYLYKANSSLTEKLFRAAGAIGVTLQAATGPQIELVGKGEALIATGLISNYAYTQSKTNPNIGVFVPRDIAVLQPAVVFITKEARHPNAAKLLLEFIMSEEGQLILASSNMVTSVISNPYVPEYSLDYLKKNVQNLVVVRLGDGIIDELLKEDVRKSFISTWKSWLGLG